MCAYSSKLFSVSVTLFKHKKNTFSWSHDYKAFSCSTQLSMEFPIAHKSLNAEKIKIIALKLSDTVFIQLINGKMSRIVGILKLMNRLNSMLSVHMVMANVCVILQCLFMRITYGIFVHTQIWHIHVNLGCIRVYPYKVLSCIPFIR